MVAGSKGFILSGGGGWWVILRCSGYVLEGGRWGWVYCGRWWLVVSLF